MSTKRRSLYNTLGIVNKSNANFVKRLKQSNRASIPDWDTQGKKIATHKLSVGEDDYGTFIYPEVQEINGQLIDFTRPPFHPFAGMNSAEERGDIVRIPSFDDALEFTKEYKQFYPRFILGGKIHIKPENRGKFTETMRRTGKSAEELSHSSNPLTRKRAIFALNARKWKH